MYDLHAGDCIQWLSELPDDSIDLLLTSPPYECARTYGIGFKTSGEAWVQWMLDLVKAAAPKCRGVICIVCEGQTRNFRYSATPLLLMADLHRAGYNLRKPPVFARVGIPGSGGPDWLRNDYEFCICVTRSGKLPWSDNTACGHTPVYNTGGPCSNRKQNGKRAITRRDANGERSDKVYAEPKIANPGNIIRCKVGGGQMGHPLAHENEAPFPLTFAEFFVKSFCPPGGVVADPCMGSGTTGHACLLHNRRFIGCDVRESQVQLTDRRLRDVMQSSSVATAV